MGAQRDNDQMLPSFKNSAIVNEPGTGKQIPATLDKGRFQLVMCGSRIKKILFVKVKVCAMGLYVDVKALEALFEEDPEARKYWEELRRKAIEVQEYNKANPKKPVTDDMGILPFFLKYWDRVPVKIRQYMARGVGHSLIAKSVTDDLEEINKENKGTLEPADQAALLTLVPQEVEKDSIVEKRNWANSTSDDSGFNKGDPKVDKSKPVLSIYYFAPNGEGKPIAKTETVNGLKINAWSFKKLSDQQVFL